MAIKIYEQFAPFANPADGDYPQGSFKNDSIPGAEDGTPLDAVWANDYAGTDAELFAQAGIVPSGQPDKLGASQRVDALKTVARKPLELKIFQSPTDGGLTEIQTRTVDVGEVYEVRKTSDGSLATIYSDAAGTTEIMQNGTDNKSGGDGVVEFYIADGDYYVEVGGGKRNFKPLGKNLRYRTAFKNDQFGSAVSNMLGYMVGGVVSGTHSKGDVYSTGGTRWELVGDTGGDIASYRPLGCIHACDFNVLADNETNDTKAYLELSAAINALEGGDVKFPKGTSKVGEQEFAGATGRNYAYRNPNPNQAIVNITNAKNGLNLSMVGFSMEWIDGLKYGSYDPVTGLKSGYSTNPDNRADVGQMINIDDLSSSVTIIGGTLLGNYDNSLQGGKYGSTDGGWQVFGTGLRAVNYKSLFVQGLTANDFTTDCIHIDHSSNAAARPVTMINVKASGGARNTLSIVGGNTQTYIDCSFTFGGRHDSNTSPGASVDIEDNLSSPRNINFINTEITNGTNFSLIAQTGGVERVTFTGGKIYSRVSDGASALSSGYPYMRFTDVDIRGKVNTLYSAAKGDARNTIFTRCTLSNTDLNGNRYGTKLVQPVRATNPDGCNAVWDGCEIEYIVDDSYTLSRFNCDLFGYTLRDVDLKISGTTESSVGDGSGFLAMHIENAECDGVRVYGYGLVAPNMNPSVNGIAVFSIDQGNVPQDLFGMTATTITIADAGAGAGGTRVINGRRTLGVSEHNIHLGSRGDGLIDCGTFDKRWRQVHALSVHPEQLTLKKIDSSLVSNSTLFIDTDRSLKYKTDSGVVKFIAFL